MALIFPHLSNCAKLRDNPLPEITCCTWYSSVCGENEFQGYLKSMFMTQIDSPFDSFFVLHFTEQHSLTKSIGYDY